MQGYTPKINAAGELDTISPGCANEFQLPNLELHLYICRELTVNLVSKEDACRSNVFDRSNKEIELRAKSFSPG